MNRLPRRSIKTALGMSLIAASMAAVTGCTTTLPIYKQSPVYHDGAVDKVNNIGHIRKELRQRLRRSGYNVMDIRRDTYRGNTILVAHAKKGNQGYELKYTYPSLRLISADRSDWSNGKKYKKHKGNKQHHDKKGHRH